MYSNILIVKLSAIGDVIHALPVAHALKKRYPASKISWIVETPAYDLLKDNPNIDDIILFDKPKFKSISGFIQHGPELASSLKQRHFDLVLDLQGLFKSAAIAWLSGAAHRMGYCNMREMSQLISKPVCGMHRNGHVIQRYLDVARALDCNCDKINFDINISGQDAKIAQNLLVENGILSHQSYIVIAPGTNWQSKCWPTGSYADLASTLAQKYKYPIVLIGGPQDDERARIIQDRANVPIVNLIGKTTLKQLAYVLQKSRLFIAGDTGPMHLAAAMGTTVIALFGPSDADRNGPFGDKHVVIRENLTCSPCFKRRCDDLQCMEQITVADVLDQIEQRQLLINFDSI
jgi:heptosyltransferase I